MFVHKIYCVQFLEVTSYVLFLFLAISFSLFYYRYYNLHFPFYTIIFAGTSIILVLSYSFLIIAFVFLMKFFKYHNNKKKGVKYMIIKLLFLLIICITFAITSFIVPPVDFWLMLFSIINLVICFLLSVSVVSLNHPLDIWCCKCCCRRSPDRAPLLPVNDTGTADKSNISVGPQKCTQLYCDKPPK